MTKRGRILRDTNVGPGLLTAEGVQYTFLLEGMWKSDVPPRTGMSVEVHFNGEGAPEKVYAVAEGQLAKEQAEQALAEARRQGTVLAGGLKARFGIVTLLAEAGLLLSFFVLPNLVIGSGFASHAMSGWEAVSFEPARMGASGLGLLNLLALVCLFAPLAVTFVKASWKRWLYVAPFAFLFLATLTLTMRIASVGHAATQAMGDVFGGAARQIGNPIAGMFSAGMGAYLALLCSLYLLTRAFKATA